MIDALTVIAPRSFAIAKDGGRVVCANETTALARAVRQLECVVFTRSTDAGEALTRYGGYGVSRTIEIARAGLLGATLRHPLSPYQIASREASTLTANRHSDTDAIVCHFEWTVPYGLALASAVQERSGRRPVVVLRAHNNERNYYRDLARSSKGLDRLYHYLERVRMRATVMDRLAASVDEVWAMTDQDAAGFTTARSVRVIPPGLYTLTSKTSGIRRSQNALGFLGSLDYPTNVSGLRWFLERVWPRVESGHPEARFRILGRGASPSLIRDLTSHRGVDFIGEVEDATDSVAELTAFVNPVFSGSGINIKLGNAIASGTPVITTPFGARGFDGGEFYIASGEADFVDQCLRVLRGLDASRSHSWQLMASRYDLDTVARQMVERLAALQEVSRGGYV